MREWLIHQMQRDRNGNSTTVATASETVGTSDDTTEMTRLLAVGERLNSVEEIVMSTFSASFNTPPSATNESQLTDDDDAMAELLRQ